MPEYPGSSPDPRTRGDHHVFQPTQPAGTPQPPAPTRSCCSPSNSTPTSTSRSLRHAANLWADSEAKRRSKSDAQQSAPQPCPAPNTALIISGTRTTLAGQRHTTPTTSSQQLLPTTHHRTTHHATEQAQTPRPSPYSYSQSISILILTINSLSDPTPYTEHLTPPRPVTGAMIRTCGWYSAR